MTSKVYIHGTYSEFVFEWFLWTVLESCGDGAAAICCKNHEQAYEYFCKFVKSKKPYLPHETTERYKIDGGINVICNHDSNENFIFADGEIELGYNDVSFVIKENCVGYDGFVLESV